MVENEFPQNPRGILDGLRKKARYRRKSWLIFTAGFLTSIIAGVVSLPAILTGPWPIEKTELQVELTVEFQNSADCRLARSQVQISRCETSQNYAVNQLIQTIVRNDQTVQYNTVSHPSANSSIIFFQTDLNTYASKENRAADLLGVAEKVLSDNYRVANRVKSLAASADRISYARPFPDLLLRFFGAALFGFLWIVAALALDLAVSLARYSHARKVRTSAASTQE